MLASTTCAPQQPTMSDAQQDSTTSLPEKGQAPTWIARKGPLRPLLALLAIVLLTAAAHMPGVGGGVLPDDNRYITENRLLRQGAGLRAIWLEPGAMDQYYPLTFTSFWAEYQIWGKDLAGYHVVNILLHAANAGLLYILLRQLGLGGAFLAAAVFALHPITVGSVAWVSERKNVLSALFYLSSMLFWVKFLHLEAQQRPTRYPAAAYIAGIVLFCMALLSKTATCTLPVVLALLVWWRHRPESYRPATAAIMPMLVIAAAMGLATIWVERNYSGAAGLEFTFSPIARVLIASRALWFYLGKLVFPVKLCMVYPRWQIDAEAWWQYAYPLLAGCTFAATWLAKKKTGPGPLAAAAIFAVTLAPTLGLVTFSYMEHSFVADHFAYMACIPLIVLGVSAGTVLAKRSDRGKSIGTIVAAAVLAFLIAATWQRSVVYADQGKLWDDTISKNASSFIVWNSRGVYQHNKGNADQAIADYTKAIQLQSNYCVAYHNRANAHYDLGRYDPAIADYTKAIANASDIVSEYRARGHLGRARAYRAMGNSLAAIDDFTEAINIDPGYQEAYSGRAEISADLGRVDHAIADCNKAIAMKPDDWRALSVRAMALLSKGNTADALDDLGQAAACAPAPAALLNNRGVLNRELGRFDQAIADFTKVIELRPQDSLAYYNRAETHYRTAAGALAMSDYGRAIELASDPNAKHIVHAYSQRGRLRGQANDHEGAIRDFDKVIELRPDLPAGYVNKAISLRKQCRSADLIAHWREAVSAKPDWPDALNSLAWLLATNPDPKCRDGQQAISLAKRTCELTGDQDPAALDTLAAAYGEAGQFGQAVETATKAHRLAADANLSHAPEMLQRLELYRSGRPYREAIGPSPNTAPSGAR